MAIARWNATPLLDQILTITGVVSGGMAFVALIIFEKAPSLVSGMICVGLTLVAVAAVVVSYSLYGFDPSGPSDVFRYYGGH